MLAWAPFEHCGFWLGLKDGAALAYAWDVQRLSKMLEPLGLGPSDVELLPESLLRAPASADGLVVQQGLDGVEAQYWKQGWPVQSRWWRQAPDDAAWQGFRKQAGLTDSANPPVEAAVWRKRPWLAGASVDREQQSSRAERLAIRTVFGLMLVLSGAVAEQIWSAQHQRDAVRGQLDAAKALAAPNIAVRSEALGLAERTNLLARELTGPRPLDVMQHLAELLPAKGVLLKELELVGNRLRLSLELSADVQRTAIVRELQLGGWFSGVTELRDSSGRGWAVFEMTLSSAQVPAVRPKRTAEQTPSSKP